MHTNTSIGGNLASILPVAVLVAVIALYLLTVVGAGRRGRSWPWCRTLLWVLGATVSASAVTGPLAERSEESFPAHMWGHLLLGMLGPVLLVLAAPVTLALRALPVAVARGLVRILRSWPLRFVSHPVVAGVVGAIHLAHTAPADQ